jgi:hypothetical protein
VNFRRHLNHEIRWIHETKHELFNHDVFSLRFRLFRAFRGFTFSFFLNPGY